MNYQDRFKNVNSFQGGRNMSKAGSTEIEAVKELALIQKQKAIELFNNIGEVKAVIYFVDRQKRQGIIPVFQLNAPKEIQRAIVNDILNDVKPAVVIFISEAYALSGDKEHPLTPEQLAEAEKNGLKDITGRKEILIINAESKNCSYTVSIEINRDPTGKGTLGQEHYLIKNGKATDSRDINKFINPAIFE